MKIVIAPDSFKGCLSARDVAECCVAAFRRELPDAEIVSMPLADGGEGLVDALAGSLDAERQTCRVLDPLGRSIEAEYLLGDGFVVMEMSQAAGLSLLNEGERNPLITSTFGVGQMILDAIDRGARKISVGLGGSATNDGGLGMLRAFGYRLLDSSGQELQGIGADLERIASIDTSQADSRLKSIEFTAACDIDNPFYGESGAAFVFAPQKGADSAMVERLDRGLRNLAAVGSRISDVDVQRVPGAGAAGGLGGAFASFLGAKLVRGIEVVLDAVDFDAAIADADLIVTGEGSVDRQSLMGKVLSGVLGRARKVGVPVVAIGGRVANQEELYRAGLIAAFSIQQAPLTLSESMKPSVARSNLAATSTAIARLITILNSKG